MEVLFFNPHHLSAHCKDSTLRCWLFVETETALHHRPSGLRQWSLMNGMAKGEHVHNSQVLILTGRNDGSVLAMVYRQTVAPVFWGRREHIAHPWLTTLTGNSVLLGL
jgi:hypothetical protein